MSRYSIKSREKSKKYILKTIIELINNQLKNYGDNGKNFFHAEIPIYINNIFFNDLIDTTNLTKSQLLLLK